MTEAAPPLSIGMPVYNGARWVRRTFDSLLDQSYPDFELIVSDNASTDETEQICREIALRDRRVRYVRQTTNIGIFPNYNAVFELGRGAMFKWASSNDLCHREFLAKCVDVLARRPDVVVCYPRTRLIDADDRKIMDYDDNLDLQDDRPSVRAERLLEQIQLNNAFNGVLRTKATARAMPMTSYDYSDVNLMLSLALSGKFYEVPEFLFFRRMDPAACVALGSKVRAGNEGVSGHANDVDSRSMMFSKYCIGMFKVVTRAQIPIGERLRLYRILARQVRWGRHQLLGEWRSGLAAPR